MMESDNDFNSLLIIEIIVYRKKVFSIDYVETMFIGLFYEEKFINKFLFCPIKNKIKILRKQNLIYLVSIAEGLATSIKKVASDTKLVFSITICELRIYMIHLP